MAALSVRKCVASLLGLLAVLDSQASAEADSPKVVKMDLSRSPATSSSNVAGRRLARRNSITVPVMNAVSQGLYFVNATVGTPPQTVQLQIDTGSSDIWFFGPDSCDESTSPCLGGVCRLRLSSALFDRRLTLVQLTRRIRPRSRSSGKTTSRSSMEPRTRASWATTSPMTSASEASRSRT